MNAERWKEIEELYHAIVDLSPQDQERRLAAITDPELRHEVRSLIEAGALAPDVALAVNMANQEIGQQLADAQETSDLFQAPTDGHDPKPRPAPLATGGLLACRYQIISFLGSGGMGDVYEAHDRELNERIALKLLRPELPMDEASLRRFRREVQLARRITHPNVCRVFDIGWDGSSQQKNDFIFLTMELVRGETLASRLKRTGRLAPVEALSIAVQLCGALEAAHRAGVIHRDFKCGNVMLTGTEDHLRAVVTDFGIARFQDPSQNTTATSSREEAIVGTPCYMSPEQLESKELTPASDIYSLGLVLYEMVTGVRPFQGESHWAEAIARLKDDPRPPSGTVPDLAQDWNFTILRCLRRDPSQRFGSAVEVAEALQGKASRSKFRGRVLAMAGTAVLVVVALAAAFRFHLFVPSLPSQKHVAVLPFAFAGNDPAQKAMADELAESLTGNLAHLPSSDGRLWVAPWKTVQARPQNDEQHAASALGVNLLLKGDLTHAGDGLRLHLRLLDAKTFKELRSGDMQVPAVKMVGLEDDLLAQACGMLQLDLPPWMLHHLPVDETTEPGAYEFYAQGRGYMLRFEASDMDRAISLFKKAIERDPKFALAYADLALAYGWKFGNTKEKSWLDQARQACSQAVSLDDKLAPAHVCLGRIQRDTNNLEQAIQEFEQALRLDPANEDARDLLSDTYDRTGRVLEAETLLKDALKRNPANWVAYDSLGVFYYRHANYTQAELLFKTAAELAPDNPIAFDHLGGIYLNQGKYKEAEAVLRRSIAIKPTATAYTNLGTALQAQNRLADSAAMLEKATEITPSNHALWFNLGNTYALMNDQPKSKQAYEKAAEMAEKNLAVSPGNGELLESLAEYYAVLGQKGKALYYQAQVKGPFATAPQTLFNSAVVYQMVGKPELALKAIHSALLAGVPVSQIETAGIFDDLRSDKRYLDIIKNYAAPTAH